MKRNRSGCLNLFCSIRADEVVKRHRLISLRRGNRQQFGLNIIAYPLTCAWNSSPFIHRYRGKERMSNRRIFFGFDFYFFDFFAIRGRFISMKLSLFSERWFTLARGKSSTGKEKMPSQQVVPFRYGSLRQVSEIDFSSIFSEQDYLMGILQNFCGHNEFSPWIIL